MFRAKLVGGKYCGVELALPTFTDRIRIRSNPSKDAAKLWTVPKYGTLYDEYDLTTISPQGDAGYFEFTKRERYQECTIQ